MATIRKEESMIRNFKALGLALVAVFAFCAMAASVASAQGKITSDGPVTLDIPETGALGSGENALTSFGNKVECPGTDYTGHEVITPAETTVPGTTHQLLPTNTTTATITPHYDQTDCTESAGRRVTVVTTGCDFVFHVGGTVAGGYAVTADVVCPHGANGIHVEVFTSGASHTSGNRICLLTVTPQNGLAGVTASNIANGDLTVSGIFKKIHVHRSGLCTLDGKGTTTATGEFDLGVKVEGTNSVGQPTDISLSD